MIYCFDIDGTLCSNTDSDYASASPFWDVIAQVNHLYGEGNQILLYTARGATTGDDWRVFTECQLKEWGVQYHLLFMGKPTADIYIDDKAMNFINWKRNGFQANQPSLDDGEKENRNE